MKRLSVILLLLAAAATLHGQHGGGSDMIPSRWWIGAGGGMNLWIGDEEETEMHPGWQLGVEVGRRMNPVLDLSLRMSAFGIQGHSRNPQHPLIDFTGQTTTAGQYPYRTFNAFGLTTMATVAVDWTNLGGELPGGLHCYTPLSVGAAVLVGRQKNPADAGHALDEMRLSGSLAAAAALGLRYSLSGMDLYGEVGAMAAVPSLDWSPEGASGIDLMPTLSLGVRFAFPSRKVTAYTPKRYRTKSESADHEPRGLVDDMLLTNETLALPATVVRFVFEDSRLDDNALRQLALLVSHMEAAGLTSKFYIVATADDAQASQEHNKKLCKSRCKSVYETLVKKFGVDGSRLLVLPDGGFSEYAHQNSEQMVLIIQRTPETREVVERWVSSY